MRLSVVIPAYNEEENIRDCVLDVVKEFPNAEIIVVNDASTDKTREILHSLQIDNLRILTNPKNYGHGYSVVRGLKIASGDYILYIDADRQLDLPYFLEPADFISGWRVHRSDKPFRKVVSFCLKMTILFRYSYYIKDANCPLKVYKRDAVQRLIKELRPTDIIPIACLEVLARRYGLKTMTIRTPHHPYQGERKGFLQSINTKSLTFIGKAFWEIVRL